MMFIYTPRQPDADKLGEAVLAEFRESQKRSVPTKILL